MRGVFHRATMYLARAASLTPASRDPMSLSFGGPFSFSHFSIWSLFRPCPPRSECDIFVRLLIFKQHPCWLTVFWLNKDQILIIKAVAVQCYQSGWRYCCSYRSEALLTKSSPPILRFESYMQKTCDVAEKAILAKKKIAEKVRKSRQNVNRDKSA